MATITLNLLHLPFSKTVSSFTSRQLPHCLPLKTQNNDSNLLVCKAKNGCFNVEVVIEDDEPMDVYVRHFQREVARAGIVQEWRRRKFFESEKEERKRKARDRTRNRRRWTPLSVCLLSTIERFGNSGKSLIISFLLYHNRRLICPKIPLRISGFNNQLCIDSGIIVVLSVGACVQLVVSVWVSFHLGELEWFNNLSS